MSGLRKKLDSLGTEIGLMDMLLANVKCALTGQPFRLPQHMRNTAKQPKRPHVGFTCSKARSPSSG